MFGVKLLSQRAPIRCLDGAIDVPSYVTFEETPPPQTFLLIMVTIVGSSGILGAHVQSPTLLPTC